MMDKDIFPQVMEIPAPQKKASYEQKCLFHERLLYQYLTRKMDGWSVKDFLVKEGIENYGLYAVTDFTGLFCKDLEQMGSMYKPGIICDRNAERFRLGFMGRPVILPGEMVSEYKKGKTKKIIIMSVLHENEIIGELLKNDILLGDIISFVSVLYS